MPSWIKRALVPPVFEDEDQKDLKLSQWFILSVVSGIAALLLRFAVNGLNQVLERARRDEWALRQERDRAQKCLDVAEVMLVILNNKGEITLINRKGNQVLGYKEGELDGRNWLDTCLPVRLREEVSGVFQKLMAGDVESVTYYENPVLTKSGGEKIIAWHNVVLTDEAGRITGILSSGEDITQRKLAEEALQRRMNELTVLHTVATAVTEATSEDALIERATQVIGDTLYPDNFGVLLLDEAANVLRCHPSYRGPERLKERIIPVGQGITGRTVVDGQPRRIPDVSCEPGYLNLDPAVRSKLCVPLKASERVIGVINAESAQLNAFAEADEQLLTTFAGQLATAIERVRLFEAECTARSRAERLQTATQALSATLDLQRIFELILSELRRVVPYDSASVQQLEGDRLKIIGGHGFPNLEEIVGLSFDLKTGNNPNREVVRTQAPFILDDAPAHYDDFHCEPHAQAGIRSWLGVPLLFGDQLIGMIALDKKEPGFYGEEDAQLALAFAAQAAIAIENARLFTEAQERAEELATALAKLEEMDQLKSEFLQNVSHELRTPLSIIMGYAELLESGDLGELHPNQQNSVAIISRRVRMLKKLVEDLTAILETEMGGLKPEPIDLAELVHTLLAEFQVAAKQAKLSLAAEIAPDVPPVLGDPTHLRRVLDNLVSNAFKFTPDGGTVTVRLQRDGTNVSLEVADTGIGIPQDKLDRIFDRFYQVDGGTSRRYGGVGLGLALVKEIVEAHGGQISVQSAPGEGTTFRIILLGDALDL